LWPGCTGKAVNGKSSSEIGRHRFQEAAAAKVRRACAASRCTPAGLTCRAAVTCVKQDHPPRGTRLRVPFFHARPYKRALGSWGGCKRFRGAVVCAMFARQGVKGRSARVFGVYFGSFSGHIQAIACRDAFL